MEDSTTTATAEAAQVEPRRPGRPKGSKTRRSSGAAGPMMPRLDSSPAPALERIFDPNGSEPKTPPASSTPPPAAKGGRPKANDVRDAELKRLITDAYARLGAMLSIAAVPAGLLVGAGPAARMAAVGDELEKNGAACATALVEWSRSNPKLRKMLENIGQGSGAWSVLLAHAPILLAAGRAPAIEAGAGSSTPAGFDGAASVIEMANSLFANQAPPAAAPAPSAGADE